MSAINQFIQKKAGKKSPVINTRPSSSKVSGGSAIKNFANRPKRIAKPQFSQPVQQSTQQTPVKASGAWQTITRNLIKPVSSAANALEDTGKALAYPIANKIRPTSFADYSKKVDFNPLQHQKEAWAGDNQRTFATIANEFANTQFKNDNIGRVLANTTGVGGDFILDPLNKVKVLGLTKTGVDALKQGKVALSAAEQAKQGQRALLQIGNTNILPSLGNKVLEASTATNDAIRSTEKGKQLFDLLSKVSTGIRPGAVSRGDFKVLKDAKNTARNIENFTKENAMQLAKDVEKQLRKKGASEEVRSQLLHAIEKGDMSLAPKGTEDIFKTAMEFQVENEAKWRSLGGSTIEGYGMAHVATPEVAEASRKKSLSGGKLFSTVTPQDMNRQWVKADGKVVNMADEGIRYDEKAGLYVKNYGKETADGGFAPKWEPVDVEQASAKEINDALKSQGKNPLFREDLPTAMARMGISTGKKEAGSEYLRITEGLTGEEGKKLASETYEKITNIESVNKFIKGFDKIQNIWKAQALMAPSYHTRNIVGNLWNNFLANVSPTDYATAGKLQAKLTTGTATKVEKQLYEKMQKLGVIGTGQYGGDITQAIADEIGGVSINPLSQRFAGYKANRFAGSAVEDNAKIAHYISKVRDGFTPEAAAESVKKYLFDYSDLTFAEQNLFKKVMPFYTWTRKNVPLQVQEFVNNPGKFSKIGIVKSQIESGVEQPDEKYMSDYIKGGAPIRTRKDEKGVTQYFLMGQWLPAASALQVLTSGGDTAIGGATPILKLPIETLLNKSSFFKDTNGQYEDLQKFPGQTKSFLGFDMNPKVINALRSIRVLNEANNLNPGGVFGTESSPSIFDKFGFESASQKTGKPDQSTSSRVVKFLAGKESGYNPEQAKIYYDKDTEDRVSEYKSALNNAIRNGQTDIAENIIKDMSLYIEERGGQPNKDVQGFNLMGERYFQDLAKDKQAEYNRDKIREQMKTLIRDGIRSGDNGKLREAIQMDPEYAKDAIKEVLTKSSKEGLSPKDQQMLYEIERMKTEKRLKPFY